MIMVQKTIRHKNKIYCYEYSEQRIKAYHDRFYKNNKKRISKRNKEILTCPHCESKVSRVNMQRHRRTKKCLNFCIDRHSDHCTMVH